MVSVLFYTSFQFSNGRVHDFLHNRPSERYVVTPRSHQFGKLQKIIMSEGVRQRTAPSEAQSAGHTYEQKRPRNGVKQTQQQR